MAERAAPFTPSEDLRVAREILVRFVPTLAVQAEARERILAWIDAHPRDAHLRSCLEGHLTASCLLLDSSATRVLLHHHAKLGRWLQFGGHCDGDANLLGVAWRETVEESGIVPEWISAEPVDLDIHVIPARPGEPQHRHFDVRYLARAPSGARERCSQESNALSWLEPAAARSLAAGDSLSRLIDIAAGTPQRPQAWIHSST